jgi:hypothetical protein
VKCNCRYLFLFFLLLLVCVPYAAAQASATFAMGFGTSHVKADTRGIKYDSTIDNYRNCTLDPLDSSCLSKATLDGLFMGFSGDALPWNHFGFGFNASFMPAKRDNYGDLKFRQVFYEFNGVYAPVNGDRAALKLMGGIGGAKTSFTYEYKTAINPQSISYESSNHFHLYAGAGLELYINKNVFIRPQFDFRYIPNFTDQFGSQSVPSGMIYIGVRTGR